VKYYAYQISGANIIHAESKEKAGEYLTATIKEAGLYDCVVFMHEINEADLFKRIREAHEEFDITWTEGKE
jgi:hypothetical protein